MIARIITAVAAMALVWTFALAMPVTKAHGARVATTGQTGDPWAKEVSRQGNAVVVSGKLADAAKRDNRIVLSKVAVKGQMDRKGEFRGYELVQVDKGSVVDRMGFRPGDLLVSVNNIPASEFNEKRHVLESARRFNVVVLRKGKPVKTTVEIK